MAFQTDKVSFSTRILLDYSQADQLQSDSMTVPYILKGIFPTQTDTCYAIHRIAAEHLTHLLW